jgi:hypothetical protein
MIKNISLSSRMRDALFVSACTMIQDSEQSLVLKDEEIEGVIHTNFVVRTLGTLSGIDANVETNGGVGQVKYLVSRESATSPYVAGQWVTNASPQQLFGALHPRPGQNNPDFN